MRICYCHLLFFLIIFSKYECFLVFFLKQHQYTVNFVIHDLKLALSSKCISVCFDNVHAMLKVYPHLILAEINLIICSSEQDKIEDTSSCWGKGLDPLPNQMLNVECQADIGSHLQSCWYDPAVDWFHNLPVSGRKMWDTELAHFQQLFCFLND